MNDLDLIRELAPDERLPGVGELASARGRLAAAIATEVTDGPAQRTAWQTQAPGRRAAAGPPGAPRVRSRWSARRLVFASVAATAIAAGVAAALIVVPGHDGQPGSTSAVVPGGVTNGASLTAAQFLGAAARAALRQPAGAPRPSQWVYSETEGPTGAKTQLWLPADGSRNGLVHPSQGAGQYPACTIAQAETKHCLPDVGYFPDMPTNPKQLFAYLDKVQIASDSAQPGEGGSWLANQLAKGVFVLMQQSYLRPAQRAALYELMADTPGFTVVPHVRDAIGRVGVAVEWTFEGGRGAVIFEPGTYEFLGVRTWPVASFHGPGAHQYDGDALIKLAIVDRVGQLP
jgi:hypothetical protein